MECNVGGTDRIIRVIVGIVLIAAVFYLKLTGVAQIVVIIVGLILLATAAMRFCPINKVLGLKTCKE